MAAQTNRKPVDYEAKAATAGIIAFDLGVKFGDCPYEDGRAEYWRAGWNERQRAQARWDSYPDRVEAMVAKAAPYIDAGTQPGQLPKSRLLLLGFYSIGSRNPDDAFAYIERNLDRLRAAYRVHRT